MLTTKSLLLLGPDPCLVVILVLCLPGASFGCVFASDWLAYLLLIGWPDNAKATCPGSFLCPLVPGCRMSPKQDGPTQEESIVANHIHFPLVILALDISDVRFSNFSFKYF